MRKRSRTWCARQPPSTRRQPGRGRRKDEGPRSGADAGLCLQVIVLQQVHADGVAVLAVGEELVDQHAFLHEAYARVDVDGLLVLLVHMEKDLVQVERLEDRKSTRLNSSHLVISY